MAAPLRAAAATRILRPAVRPGEGLRRLVHTQPQLDRYVLKTGMCSCLNSAPARALEEGYRGSQIQQKKEELYVASQLDRHVLKTLCMQVKHRRHDPRWRPATTANKVTKWTATALACLAGAVVVGALATADGQDDWPHCHGCGECIPKKCNQCGRKLPRPSAEAIQAASECGHASGAAQN